MSYPRFLSVLGRTMVLAVPAILWIAATAARAESININRAGKPLASYGGAGIDSVSIAPFLVPTANITPLLPEGLEFVDANAAYHAIALLFGEQSNVHKVSAATGATIPSSVAQYFLEYSLVVPGVQISAAASGTGHPIGPFTHMVKLYLDDWGAIQLGRWPFGYNKVFGHIKTDKATYTVKDAKKKQIVSAAMKTQTSWNQPAFFQNLNNLFSLMPTNFVAYRDDGRWVCSNMVFAVDTADFSPLQMDLKFGDDLKALIGTDSASLTGLDQNPLGALRMNSRWNLSVPMTCY